jgi:inorganic pyrophosphatase
MSRSDEEKVPDGPTDESVEIVVEIPKGSRNKYEYDPETGRFFLDRMLFSSMHYPADYGFVPDTLARDGDPLDVLVLVGEATFPGCVIETRPVGVFHMRDEKGPDEKVLCVPVHDPQWNWIEELDQVPKHLVREITHFFEVYKELEEKETEVGGWADREEAWEVLRDARSRHAEGG